MLYYDAVGYPKASVHVADVVDGIPTLRLEELHGKDETPCRVAVNARQQYAIVQRIWVYLPQQHSSCGNLALRRLKV